MEGGVEEAWTENEHGEDRSDVDTREGSCTSVWMVRRSSKWMALCTLEEWLRRIGIQRQKCDVGYKQERMLGER